MINLDKFDVFELWKEFSWVFIYDDIGDAKQLAPAIRHHPDLTDEIASRFDTQLAKILRESIPRCSLPWIRFALDERTRITPAAIYDIIFSPINNDERLAIFDTIFERGWDVNSTDDDGSPFLNSITHSEEMTSWFIAHGADPNRIDPRTRDSALDRAAEHGSIETIRLLLREGACFSSGAALQLAVSRPEDDFVILPILNTLLLEPSIHVNFVEQDLDTALHAAVWLRSIPRAMLLIKHGADPNQPGSTRPTPIEYAYQLRQPAMEQMLRAGHHGLSSDGLEEFVVVEEEDELRVIDEDGWDTVPEWNDFQLDEETGIETWIVPGLQRT